MLPTASYIQYIFFFRIRPCTYTRTFTSRDFGRLVRPEASPYLGCTVSDSFFPPFLESRGNWVKIAPSVTFVNKNEKVPTRHVDVLCTRVSCREEVQLCFFVIHTHFWECRNFWVYIHFLGNYCILYLDRI